MFRFGGVPQAIGRTLRSRIWATTAAVTAGAMAVGGSASAGPSGLPWQSGAGCSWTEFEEWRGRKMDVYLMFTPHQTWASMLKHYQGGTLNKLKSSAGTPTISMPMLPWESKGRFSDCAAGKFDSKFREFGQALVAKGQGDAYIRLGWEAGNGSHPWFVGSQLENYKKCWRREAQVLKSVSSRFKMEWANARRGEQKFDITKVYPGDDVVDVIGTHNYDRYPNYSNQGEWDENYNKKTPYGQPWGMGAWLSYAKSRGKKLAVSEWAVSDGYSNSGSVDNPFYIEKMNEFFRRNAGSIAYETYFNCTGGKGDGVYKIHPSSNNPRAAAKYKELW